MTWNKEETSHVRKKAVSDSPLGIAELAESLDGLLSSA